ncbi:MAG TPA: ABC transporter ATP-binding protein [Polyangia bacterium]|nr:ABC transporter ATP-binding protein [Polyangia bacterium]
MTGAAAPLLEVRDLHVSYGHIAAVRGVSLAVAAGGIVTLIGPNGAGKTSILSALSGLVPPRAGTVRLDSRDITGLPAHDTVAAGLALVPEGRAILGRMTIEENLVLAGERRQPPGRLGGAIDDQYSRFPILGERRHQPAGSLSGGQQQMLAFARALLARPRLLLLDEPSMGLSPILVQQIFETINTIHRDGTTILLVEQNARLALSVADYAYVLERGAVVLEGRPGDLAEDERVKDVYLGGG